MNATPNERPKVGVAVFIWRDGKFLMYRHKGSHAEGTISVPGGHLEYGESWEACAAREAKEEVGVQLKHIRYLATTNDIMETESKHYISIWLTADWAGGEPRIMEPDKIEELGWYTFATLPEPLFEPCWQNLRQTKPELFQKQ